MSKQQLSEEWAQWFLSNVVPPQLRPSDPTMPTVGLDVTRATSRDKTMLDAAVESAAKHYVSHNCTDSCLTMRELGGAIEYHNRRILAMHMQFALDVARQKAKDREFASRLEVTNDAQ